MWLKQGGARLAVSLVFVFVFAITLSVPAGLWVGFAENLKAQSFDDDVYYICRDCKAT
jgi:hypothetical protein